MANQSPTTNSTRETTSIQVLRSSNSVHKRSIPIRTSTEVVVVVVVALRVKLSAQKRFHMSLQRKKTALSPSKARPQAIAKVHTLEVPTVEIIIPSGTPSVKALREGSWCGKMVNGTALALEWESTLFIVQHPENIRVEPTVIPLNSPMENLTDPDGTRLRERWKYPKFHTEPS